ncbi:MAG: polysulfide reductase [Thiobacillus sp.]|nr:polysulfide reductase [Thiobacillus sp.]
MLPEGALNNYIFPNNVHIDWSLMIVLYPYITGLVAGAFVVSALYHVFKVKELETFSRFALVASFCFGLFAALPLMFHLGQPLRAFNIFFTPHTTSAMSIFGYVYSSYMILVMVELWLVYRKFFIEKAQTTRGLQRLIWKALALGVTQTSPGSLRLDQGLIALLAGIGIPWAFVLHGYVGFIFGSVKANAWWATPLQPIIFLMSAIVSGIAMLMLMYSFIRWRSGRPYDFVAMRRLMDYLWGLFILDVTFESLEIVYMFYEHGHHWAVVGPLLQGKLFGSYVIGQMLVLSGLPLLLLGYVVLFDVTDRRFFRIANFAALSIVLQVLLMRFNVVIGGQMISKSDRGYVDFHFEWFAREGVIPALIILAAPFVTYWVISRFLPIFSDDTISTSNKGGQ